MEQLSVLRKLARQYYECAMDPVNMERMKLHRAVNDLKMERPVVLIDDIPFGELNFDGSLTLQCEDPVLRKVEDYFRKKLFQWKYFPGDMILSPYVGVEKVVHDSGIGVEVKERTVVSGTYISSHEYEDQLSCPEALERVKLPVITYDPKTTMENYTKVAEAIGDIVPVRICGYGYTGPVLWDQISELRGVTNLLIDLVDDPEFSHQVVSKIAECEESRMQQQEDLGLLDFDNFDMLHSTTSLCSDLEKEYDGGKVLRKHIWGRAKAQIFGSVSKAMHMEFDITYMKKLLAPFGLNYYGCCEPLDKKIDIVSQIPNLRKVSITPWADVDVAAEAIGRQYVVANKPNPSAVAIDLDEDALRKELGRTLAAVKRNDCSCDIVLKDLSTVGGKLENLVRWERIAMELVRNA